MSSLVTQTSTGWVTHGIEVSWETLHSPDHEPWPSILIPRLRVLLDEYGWICKLANTPFPVHFGYRSMAYQLAFHSGRSYLHTQGWALDILPCKGWTPARMSVYARQRWIHADSLLCGIGIYTPWLHVDIRPRLARRLWYGGKTMN
jgi:hypothetical protein